MINGGRKLSFPPRCESSLGRGSWRAWPLLLRARQSDGPGVRSPSACACRSVCRRGWDVLREHFLSRIVTAVAPVLTIRERRWSASRSKLALALGRVPIKSSRAPRIRSATLPLLTGPAVDQRPSGTPTDRRKRVSRPGAPSDCRFSRKAALTRWPGETPADSPTRPSSSGGCGLSLLDRGACWPVGFELAVIGLARPHALGSRSLCFGCASTPPRTGCGASRLPGVRTSRRGTVRELHPPVNP